MTLVGNVFDTKERVTPTMKTNILTELLFKVAVGTVEV